MEKKNLIIIIVSVIMAITSLCIIGILFFNILNNFDQKETTQTTSKKETTNETIVKQNNTNNEENNKEEKDMYSLGTHHATIVVKDYGTIKLELDADTAPITVSNFANLVNEGFYDGLTFHRIMDGFMIQGGDPEGTGFGGSSETIKGEFKANGVENNISHVRGVISMARASSYDSASSQFFIVHKDSVFLDGQYAAFGKVTSGMEFVDKICEDTKVEDGNGTVLRNNQPIIEKVTMID